MENKELINFIEWIMKNEESPRGMSIEETVSWINDLSKTEEGKEILTRLTNTYKNSDMKLFEKGGKLDYLLCLQKGGAIQDCGCGKKIEKNQPGGEISRRDALNILRTTGSGNAESRKEYRDAKRDARESGLRGKEMRQAARNATMERGVNRILPALDDNIEIEEIPISFENPFTNIDVPTSLGISIMDKVPVTPNDVIGGSFKEAFAEARKRGLKDFVWDNDNAKYSRYSTALAKPDKLAIRTAPSADDTFVEKYVPANHNPGGMPAAAYDVLYTLGANLRKRK